MQPDTMPDTARLQSVVTTTLFRDAMSRLGAPVTIVTTSGPAGRQGLTVSAMTSVSDTPPTVLVCLNRANRSHEAFVRNGVIGISLLSQGHEDIAGTFASSTRSADEKFAMGAWHADVTGAPLLVDALATFDCTISTVHLSGSHDVMFCAVKAIRIHPAASMGLAWFGRQFHCLPSAGDARRDPLG
ncbi:flavin reductase [Komagataeibacter oboediens]|uniref:flavin reductase n=2 Tax=Komagataeibacter oboediens TaxID=65958 RepID=UPI0020B8C1D1|nr:flavin reductase [Komagataeibacter oboediens]